MASNKRGNAALFGKKTINVVLSATLGFSLLGVMPAAAQVTGNNEGNESTLTEKWLEAANVALTTPGFNAYNFADTSSYSVFATNDEDAATLPSEYYLSSTGVVTPVKLQNPWGTCWGFSTIAACESSILSEAKTTYEATKLDLSELQLANAAITAAPEEYVGEAQAGEGYHNSSQNKNRGLEAGGLFSYASTLFSVGVGPLLESQVPYKNSEGVKECLVIPNGASKASIRYLTDAQIQELKDKGGVVVQLNWAGNYEQQDSESGETKTVYTDWSVLPDTWNQTVLEFENGNILPSTVLNDADGSYAGIDFDAVAAIKKEMYQNGRAVAITFHADTSLPNEEGVSKYMDTNTWSHYTYEQATMNHGVTIVGWSDNYSKDNFNNAAGKKPEGDGAWLVKNSWGSDTEEFPNDSPNHWGIKDENGNHTGYFWLSYYDQSISKIETFDFDLNSYGASDEVYVDAYDYLPENGSLPAATPTKMSAANVFTASADIAIRTLGCTTYKPNTTVTYEVYLLDDEATTPADPNHSTLVLTAQDTYTYGGYHRTTVAESDWVAVREGQRYSVVTTQKCNDDNNYYVGIAYNAKKPSEGSVDQYQESMREYYRTLTYQNLYAQNYDRLFKEFKDQGETDEVAKQLALEGINTLLNDQTEAIEKQVAYSVDIYENTYYESKVNEGESFYGEIASSGSGAEESGAMAAADMSAAAGEAGDVGDNGAARESGEVSSQELSWSDWTDFKAQLDEIYPSICFDNAAIKAISEFREWASVGQLDQLKQQLSAAKELFSSLKVSPDGTDVPEDQLWMNQQEYDALKDAIKEAEQQLENAGDFHNELKNTTPSPDETNAVLAALKVSGTPGTQASAKSGSTQPSGVSAKTGDFAATGLLIFGGTAAIAGACAYVLRRRKTD